MKRLVTLAVLISTIFFFQSCDEDSPTGVDFSDAPAPFDTTNAVSSTTSEDDLTIYIIEEGDGNFEVNKNDQIQVRFTGRTTDGEIFDSSYRNGSEEPSLFQNLTAGSSGNNSSLIEGFRRGLMGMTEGERRTIVVPSELGYGDSDSQQSQDSQTTDLSGETLIFDVELVEIVDP